MIGKIPPWVLRFALLLSLPIAAAALYLTRSYAVGNLAILGLDAETVFVRRLSIDVLLAAHVAAFFLCALLPDSGLKFRRWQLYSLALAIWVFDAGAIYQARFGVMDSAEQAQVSASNKTADMRAALAGLQKSAEAMRATAARQMANKMITLGAQSQAEAARLEAKAATLAEKLATMPTGAGTTEVRTWGALAPYKAATESALISFVSLIMLGLAGLMLRELLQSAIARPATKPSPAKRPTRPAPAEPTMRPLRARLETGRAMVAPDAPVPAPARPDDALEADALEADALAPAGDAPAQVQDAPRQVQKVRLEKSAGAAKPVPDGVRDAIRSGAIRPSQGGIKSLGHGQALAEVWLGELGAEGLIERNPSGKGWKLKA